MRKHADLVLIYSEDLMNIHHCYTLRNLFLAAALTVGFVSSALAQTRALFVDLNSKEVTDLGTLGGKDSTTASGINDAGQVAGYSYPDTGPSHAFLTGPNGLGMTDLGTLRRRDPSSLRHQGQ